MNIVFIHQNFPAQFRYIAQHISADSHNHVIAICQEYAPGRHDSTLSNINHISYKPSRLPSRHGHHYLRQADAAVLNGQAVLKVLLQLKKKGYLPDAIIAHTAWGEALYVKDIYPQVPLIGFFEFFYRAHGADAGFDPEFPMDIDDQLKLRTRTAIQLLSLEAVDIGISPTAWQRSVFPKPYLGKIAQIHEGINTVEASPDPAASFALDNGIKLSRQDEVVTYVARNLEPYRGFHQFMRAVAILCERRPSVHVLIVGGDGISYGSALPDGRSWREKMLSELTLNTQRVHFLGKLPYRQYLTILQISTAHVYLTVPFVLSWSMLEAMSVGCLVIGSNTKPVREVIRHQENGLLVDFFNPHAIADSIDYALDQRHVLQNIRAAARLTIEQSYSVEQGLQGYAQILQRFISSTSR